MDIICIFSHEITLNFKFHNKETSAANHRVRYGVRSELYLTLKHNRRVRVWLCICELLHVHRSVNSMASFKIRIILISLLIGIGISLYIRLDMIVLNALSRFACPETCGPMSHDQFSYGDTMAYGQEQPDGHWSKTFTVQTTKTVLNSEFENAADLFQDDKPSTIEATVSESRSAANDPSSSSALLSKMQQINDKSILAQSRLAGDAERLDSGWQYEIIVGMDEDHIADLAQPDTVSDSSKSLAEQDEPEDLNVHEILGVI